MITDVQKLQTIMGEHIALNSNVKLVVKQYTLREVSQTGYEKHNLYLSILSQSVSDMLESLKDTEIYEQLKEQEYDLSKIEMVSLFSVIDPVYALMLGEALDYFIGGATILNEVVSDVGRILIKYSDEDIELMKPDELHEIIEVIKYSNSLSIADEDENPYDERAKQLLKKLKKNRDKVKQMKQDSENSKPLHDIISAITVKSSSINKFNILDLTLFQIYDEYKRLHMIESYHISLQSLMHGAKNLELVQWDKPIE